MFTALLDFLFPPRCPGCREYTEKLGDWCLACREKYLTPKLFLEAEGDIEAILCLCPYEGAVRDVLRRLKFRRDEGALPYLHRMIQSAMDEDGDALRRFRAYLADEKPIFVPVALHPRREKERGFNQAVMLWREYLTGRGYEWLEVLERTRETQPQYRLSRSEREENVRGAFGLRSEYGEQVKGRTVVLVDDILTSGATLRACAQALKKAQPKKILAITAASGRDLQRKGSPLGELSAQLTEG